MSVKILEKMAARLELATDTAAGWGTSASLLTPAANSLLPYTSFDKGMNAEFAEDNSIVAAGFPDTPIQSKLGVEKSFGMNMWYTGINHLLYWIFGFENTIKIVRCFVCSVPTIEPIGGATYTNNAVTYTFLRKEVQRSQTLYIFSGASSTTTGSTLTKTGGTGDTTLTFSAASGILYEHTFELDADTRHVAAFDTAEQITGWASGMRKQRSLCIGLSTSVTDLIYLNCVCKKFGLKSSAGQIVSMDSDFVAYKEYRGNYSSSGWTLPAALLDNSQQLIHHQLRFKIGTTESALVNLGVSDVNFGLDIPLDNIQDTESGLYIAEPVMEGKYKISLDAKLSRYAATTYAGYKDAWTTVCGVLEAFTGYNGFELMFNTMKISGAGPDGGNVESEPLKFEFGNAANAFPLRLYGTSLIQNGPVVLRVRNGISTNMEFNAV